MVKEGIILHRMLRRKEGTPTAQSSEEEEIDNLQIKKNIHEGDHNYTIEAKEKNE